MRIVCLALLVVGCGVYEEGSEVGFIGYPQVPNYENYPFLITKVHKPSWTIGYYFGERCGVRTSEKSESLKLYVEYMLNLWLEPIRESPLTKRKVVSDFLFKHIQEPIDLTRISKIFDFFIKFDCSSSLNENEVSHVKHGDHSPLVVLQKFDPNLVNPLKTGDYRDNTGYEPFVILHELGHVIGLLDTYASPNHSVKGESYDYFHSMIGNHPPSVMSGYDIWLGGDFGRIGRHYTEFRLTEDDKKGIEWLYKNYFHQNKVKNRNECYFPTYEMELLHKDGSKGCVPSNPVTYLIKNGYPADYITTLIKEEPALRPFVKKKEKQGNQLSALHYAAMSPYSNYRELFKGWNLVLYTDNLDIKDKRGQTPLHYTIRAMKDVLTRYLVDTYGVKLNGTNRLGGDKFIDLKAKLPNGMTYLHFAAQFGNYHALCPLLERGNIDETLEDKWGLTPLDRANARLRYWKRKGDKNMIERMKATILILTRERRGEGTDYGICDHYKRYTLLAKTDCQKEAEQRANGSDIIQRFKHSNGFTCACRFTLQRWSCSAIK